MTEMWKDISNYEGLYQISNQGRIKSLIGYNGHKYIKRKKILKLSIQHMPRNYNRNITHLIKNKVKKSYKVHRLVAKAFIPNPFNKPEINHIDSNPLNNNVDNLEWATSKENKIHSILYGGRKKVYDEQAVIDDYINTAMTRQEIATKHKITIATFSGIKQRNNLFVNKRKKDFGIYKIQLDELLLDFQNGMTNKELYIKYNCSKNLIATRKYQFKKRGLLCIKNIQR